MDKEQRDHVLSLLFGSTLKNLDKLRDEGVNIPSEVYMQLGMLHGNISGIFDHIQINYNVDIERYKRKLKSKGEPEESDDSEESGEEQLELDTLDKDIVRRNVVRLRDE